MKCKHRGCQFFAGKGSKYCKHHNTFKKRIKAWLGLV